MATVDTKIVEMRFDNAEFERRISTTMQSLANLDKTIGKLGSKEGLADLAKQVGSFSMEGMSSAIEGVSAKFLSLATIGITALANLTNKAIDAGISIAKSLAFDQIASGFQEYELKLGSIQTIMAGSGESLDVVNKKLAELNAYSDKTIYSFKDMTSNIGKFTNAGVDLDTSVAAIQGIANVAAVSGANSEEASRAMYNFAQALSKGSVALIDWKSIELANMGTVEFKQQLIDAAAAQGKLTKKGDQWVTSAGTMVSATQGFNESLTDQWLTTDVLTKTLGDYADETTDIGKKAFAAAQDIKTFSQLMDTTKEAIGSGWAQSFEILIGNFDRAKWVFSGLGERIGNFVNKNAEARNNLLQSWSDMGGGNELLMGLVAAFDNVMAILKPIKDAFREIFPPMTAERLYDMTVAFHKFADALKPSESTVENIKSIFKGLFNVLDVGWTILKTGVSVIADFVQGLTGIGEGDTLGFLAKIGDALSKLTVEGVYDAFKTAFDKIVELIKSPLPVLEELWDKITEFWNKLTGLSGDAAGGAINQVKDRFENLKSAADKVKDILKPIQETFDKVKGVFSDAWDAIKDFFTDLGQTIADAADSGDYNKVADALTIGLLGGILAGIAKFLKNGINIDFGGGIIKGMKEALGELTDTLGAMQTKLKAEALEKIAIAIGILTASILVLSLIDAEALAKALAAIAVGFGQLMGAFAILQKMTMSPKTAMMFTLLAVGLTLLAGAAVLFGVAALIISTMDWDELARGMIGLLGIMTLMVGVAKVLEGQTTTLMQAGAGMLVIGLAIGILALSMKIFASMNWEEMAQGFVGVIGSLLGIAGAMKLMPNDMASRTAGILGVAGAMVVLGFAMKIFASLSWAEMIKGLVGVAGALSGVAIGLKLMPKNMATSGASILIVSLAMVVLAKAMQQFSQLSFTDIAKGVLAIVATLTVIAVAMRALEGSLKGGVGLLVLTYALSGLAGVLETFASLSIGTIVSGLLAMAAVLGVLAGVAYLLQPAIPAMFLLGVALALVGGGVAALGLGISLVVGAFVTLSAAGADVKESLLSILEAIGGALPALMRGFAEGLLEMGEVLLGGIPMFVGIIGDLIIALLEKLTELLPAAEEFMVQLVDSICGVLEESIPRLVEAGWAILMGFLNGIEENIGELVTTVGNIITTFLDEMSVQIPLMRDSIVGFLQTLFTNVASGVGELAATLWVDIGIALLDGIWTGLKDSVSKIFDFFSGFIGDIIDFVKGLFGISSPSTVFSDIGGWLMEGLLGGVVDGFVAVWNWFSNLATTILSAVGNFLTTLAGKGWDLLKGLWDGLWKKWVEVALWFNNLGSLIVEKIGDALGWLKEKGSDIIRGMKNGINSFVNDKLIPFFTELPGKILDWMGNALEWLVDAGKNIIKGLWNGLNAMKDWIMEKVKGMVSWITGPFETILGLFSPSRLFIEYGEYIGEGLIIGIDSMGRSVVASAEGMGYGVAEGIESSHGAISEALKKVTDSLENSVDFSPVITPVLDLSNVKAGAKELNGLIGNSSYANASLIASTPRDVATDKGLTPSTGGVVFNQTNNSPKELSTAEIYRQTRNQIALAKEELSIP